jgi:protein-tyrosine phosphatase
LLLEFSERFEQDEVPDPYYGGTEGFEHVLDLVEDAAQELLRKLASK